MHRFLFFTLACFVLLGAGCAPSPSENEVQIAFSGSFENGGTCHKYDQTGCDLYLATYDLETNALISLQSLSDETESIETFPAVSPDAEYVLYQYERDGSMDMWYVIPETLERGLLIEHAQAPYLSMDGTLLAYWRKTGKNEFQSYLRTITWDGSSIELGPEELLTGSLSAKEPIIFPDNTLVAYYESGAEPMTGQTLILDRSTGEEFAFSRKDGCSHGSVSPDGSQFFCDIYDLRDYDGSWSPLRTVSPQQPDSHPFSEDCEMITYGHAEYCGDSEYILATASCKIGTDTVAAALVFMDLEGAVIGWFHESIENELRVSGTQSRSGICTAL